MQISRHRTQPPPNTHQNASKIPTQVIGLLRRLHRFTQTGPAPQAGDGERALAAWELSMSLRNSESCVPAPARAHTRHGLQIEASTEAAAAAPLPLKTPCPCLLASLERDKGIPPGLKHGSNRLATLTLCSSSCLARYVDVANSSSFGSVRPANNREQGFTRYRTPYFVLVFRRFDRRCTVLS